MVKRIKIGFIYSYNEEWIAGAYYILNLINALNTLEDKQKPELIILSYTPKEFETVEVTKYPYLTFHQLIKEDLRVSYSVMDRILNKMFRPVLRKNIIFRTQTRKRLKHKMDIFFPATRNAYFNSVNCKIFWIPDFQEWFLPHFFSVEEIQSRKLHNDELAKGNDPIVFSSYNAQEHFKKNYPSHRCQTFVLQFAVTHPPYKTVDHQALLRKYEINKPYFFCPNQFWAHKNHLVVLQAISLLKNNNKEVLVLFSGKEADYRNPEFFSGLKKYVAENKLEEQVKFLGFIDRLDQLQLINHAIAVIQPSLFEGWSTVVEDAKSIGKHVLLSDLAVHREQMTSNVTFFNPQDANELATCMSQCKIKEPLNSNYGDSIKLFGKQFMKIAETCLNKRNS